MDTFMSPDVSTIWYAYFSTLVFCLGACVGSFLNVCIYRIPMELSVISPGSHCYSCKRPIAWYDNVPILAYILLRGRCRRCGASFSPRYCLVELLVAVLFVLTWFKFSWQGAEPPIGLVAIDSIALVPIYWLMVGGLVLGTFVDVDHFIIPDRVSLGGIIAGLLLAPLVPAMHGAADWWGSLREAAIGAAVGWGSLWTVGFIGKLIFRKDAMGFGDVKLLGAMGAFLGWEAIIFIIIASSFAGSVVGLSLVAVGKKEMQGRIPFGPYLSLGAILWMLWGQTWWQAYLNFVLTPRI
jgi:leader peptidase (prepilin peptidase)/N-methyltransferase